MTFEEFQKFSGIELPENHYYFYHEIVEPLYYASSLDKEAWCKNFAKGIKAEELAKWCENYNEYSRRTEEERRELDKKDKCIEDLRLRLNDLANAAEENRNLREMLEADALEIKKLQRELAAMKIRYNEPLNNALRAVAYEALKSEE